MVEPQKRNMSPEETKELLRLRSERQQRHDATEDESSENESYGGIGGFKRRTWALFSIMGGLIYGYNVRCD